MESVSTAKANDATSMAHVLDEAHGENWSLWHGDCIDVMRGLPDDSVHYSVFSPPFASLYTYSSSLRDLGNCKNLEEFNEHFRYVAAELRRVLLPGRLVSFHCMKMPHFAWSQCTIRRLSMPSCGDVNRSSARVRSCAWQPASNQSTSPM